MFDASMSVLDLYFVLMSMSYVYFIYMLNTSMLVLVSDAYSKMCLCLMYLVSIVGMYVFIVCYFYIS
jgi:hypothetical protein